MVRATGVLLWRAGAALASSRRSRPIPTGPLSLKVKIKELPGSDKKGLFGADVMEATKKAQEEAAKNQRPPSIPEERKAEFEKQKQATRVEVIKDTSSLMESLNDEELQRSRARRREILQEAIVRGRERAEADVDAQTKGAQVEVSDDDFLSLDSLHVGNQLPTRRELWARDLKARKFRGDPYENPHEPLPVYPRRKKVTKRIRGLMHRINDIEELAMLKQGRSVVKEKIPHMRIGDIVRLKLRDIYNKDVVQYFQGVCIDRRLDSGIGSTFVLRNTVEQVAVERGFHYYSPTIIDAKIVGYKKKRNDERDLFYLRDRPIEQSAVGNPFQRDPEMTKTPEEIERDKERAEKAPPTKKGKGKGKKQR